jgi:tetratricopeptide (TPR) repeat protein
LDPAFAMGHLNLARCYEAAKIYPEATSGYEQAVILSDRAPVALAGLARIYAVSGNRSKAQKLLDQLLELSRHRYVSAYDIALVHFGLGNVDRGFEWLEKAFKERSGWLASLRVEPRFDTVRQHRRLKNLENKIGIPQ